MNTPNVLVDLMHLGDDMGFNSNFYLSCSDTAFHQPMAWSGNKLVNRLPPKF
jgi:hypothetical protein